MRKSVRDCLTSRYFLEHMEELFNKKKLHIDWEDLELSIRKDLQKLCLKLDYDFIDLLDNEIDKERAVYDCEIDGNNSVCVGFFRKGKIFIHGATLISYVNALVFKKAGGNYPGEYYKQPLYKYLKNKGYILGDKNGGTTFVKSYDGISDRYLLWIKRLGFLFPKYLELLLKKKMELEGELKNKMELKKKKIEKGESLKKSLDVTTSEDEEKVSVTFFDHKI